MVHYLSLHTLKTGTQDADLDQLILAVRIVLAKLADVQGFRCGKNTDSQSLYGFFFALDCESRERLALIQEDPIYVKMLQDDVNRVSFQSLNLVYEGEIGRNVKYS
jgi:hypothetical protein